jgi:hypothetical protein
MEDALDALQVVENEAARVMLSSYLARAGKGSERAIARRMTGAKLETGLAIVDALVSMGTDEAKRLLLDAVPQLKAPLRVAVMASVDGEQTRAEVRRAFEEDDAGARAATLHVIERRNVRAAGPLLVLRARAPEFDELSPKERRETLSALASLTPVRAEAIGIELLSDTRLFRSSAREKTRELAAEMLGRVGATTEARTALASAAKGGLRQSDGVRAAAAKALAMMADRQASPKSAPKPTTRSIPGTTSPPTSRRKVTLNKRPPSSSRRPPPSKRPR